MQKAHQEMDKHRKRKRSAAEFEDTRAGVECGKVQSTLEVLLPEMESWRTQCGLFLVASDALHTKLERQVPLERQKAKQVE